MKCPMCGAETYFDFSRCPRCGYQLTLEAEQPLPNWRRLPGFRSRTPWKMILAAIAYILILFTIVAASFSF